MRAKGNFTAQGRRQLFCTATDMEKAIHALMHGTFNAMKGPLLCILMLSIVVSLVRSPPGRLFAASAPEVLPPP
jgi:hypothetical protein